MTSNNKNASHIVAVWLLTLVLSLACLGGPMPTPGSENLPQLLANADVVLKGQVLAVLPRGETTAEVGSVLIPVRLMSATVGVDRYYKGGGATPQITVTFFVARDPRHSDLPFQQLATGEYALFFLKEGSGRYTFSDPWFGKLEVSRRLAEDTADTHDPATLLEADLRAGLAEASRDLLLDNIRLLGNLRRLRSSRELHPFASSDDLEVRGAANLALMRVGDYSMIEEAVEFLLLQDPNPRIRALQGKLANEFESVKDPATLDVIHRYMRSDNQMVRIAMVKAAERIHSPKAVPWLVERLDDPVEDVRYHAVLALCEMEGKGPGGWGAAIDVYDQNESQYISKWKQWWETEGKFKYR